MQRFLRSITKKYISYLKKNDKKNEIDKSSKLLYLFFIGNKKKKITTKQKKLYLFFFFLPSCATEMKLLSYKTI